SSLSLPPPTPPPFPYTTLFRSSHEARAGPRPRGPRRFSNPQASHAFPWSPLMKRPLRVAVTGAAGQIGYSLLFRIASGEMLGKRSEEHTSELQSRENLVCRLLL